MTGTDVSATERFLVTGAMGCIGAWAVAHLVRDGASVTTFDLSDNDSRWQLIMSDEERGAVRQVKGDLTNADEVAKVVQDNAITHIIHLGGLQFPFCKADPVLGARVNVVGTTNVFMAAAADDAAVRGIAYASSVAVFGRADEYPNRTVADDSELNPGNFYGVYKQANEHSARIFHLDRGIGSVGLRPSMVYGAGRDQGITADPTLALEAALRNEPFEIKFGGRVAIAYASDVARDFISAARAEVDGAFVHNTRARSTTIEDIVGIIDELTGKPGLVTVGSNVAETAEYVDDYPVSYLLAEADLTSLSDGFAETAQAFIARDSAARAAH